MGVKRFVLAAAFALLGAAWVRADTTQPGHFIVDLNNVPGTDLGGWGAETLFTDTVNTINSTKGFTANICVDSDAGNPNGDEPDCDNDPRMSVNSGGASMPFPSSFNADANGGGTFDFQNNGNAPITDILFTTTFVPTDSYTCESGQPTDIFQFCGFQIVNQGGVQKIEILFDNGTIPIAAPEPSQYWLLLACVAVAVVHQLRSRRRSA